MKKRIWLAIIIILLSVGIGYAADFESDGKQASPRTIYTKNSDGGIVAVLSGVQGIDDSVAISVATDHYDEDTRALNVIDYPHHEIHSGSNYYIAEASTIADDATLSFCVTTSASEKWAHMTWEIETTEPTTYQIWEDATISGFTSGVTTFNSNRNSTNTSTLDISMGATITDYGTKIYERQFGYADTPAKTGGGSHSHDIEIILKQNARYLFLMWSQAADNIVSYHANWYEHTDKSNT